MTTSERVGTAAHDNTFDANAILESGRKQGWSGAADRLSDKVSSFGKTCLRGSWRQRYSPR